MARPSSDIPDRLIVAAREQFLKQGVDGASLRTIASEAGTSIGMIYYHFRTKDDLFLAVVEEVYADLLSELEIALSPERPVEERLRALFERFGRMSDAETDTIRLVLREALVPTPRVSRIFERFQRGHIPLLLQTLAEGMQSGAIASHHPVLALVASVGVSAVLVQVLRRQVSQAASLPVPVPASEDLASAMFELFLSGARPRPEPSPDEAPSR